MTGTSKDLTGRTFGLWTVLGTPKANRYRQVFWRCRCACLTVRDVRADSLLKGRSKGCMQCRCAESGRRHGGRNRLDLTGEFYGQWRVLRVAYTSGKGELHWLCVCTCGTEQTVRGASLRTGRSTRCRSCVTGVRTKEGER